MGEGKHLMQRVRNTLKVALPLLLIGLLVPGGSLVVVAILFKGGLAADLLPAKVAAFLPFLKSFHIR